MTARPAPPARAAARKPIVPTTLYHYTCHDHGGPGIAERLKVIPARQPFLGRTLAWFTDMDTPDPWALGLTNAFLCCDRTQVRVAVRPHEWRDLCGIRPWWTYRRTVEPVLRELLEEVGLPMHWWVTDQPVPIADITPTPAVWAARKAARHA